MAMARASPACFRGSRTPSPRTRSLVLAGYSVAALGEARLRRSGPLSAPQEHLSPALPGPIFVRSTRSKWSPSEAPYEVMVRTEAARAPGKAGFSNHTVAAIGTRHACS
jgi:hypothetical protein